MPRPFPWKCRNCGERNVNPTVVDYSVAMDHDGRSYSVTVPQLELLECESCHNRVLSDEALEKLANALRAKAGLLTPAEIRHQREALRLTQKQLANYLRVSESTVSRWETGGQIQQRAMDLLLRVFFGVRDVRELLADETRLKHLGTEFEFPKSVQVKPTQVASGTVIDAMRPHAQELGLAQGLAKEGDV